MRWKVLSERPLYRDEWLDIRIADVELPDGRRLAHRSIRTPPGAGVVAVDEQRRVLLLWRHRFITDTWGWEIPIGRVEDGETPEQTAAREFEEETGWRAGPLRRLVSVQPSPGLSDAVHHVYSASQATYLGAPGRRLRSRADRVGAARGRAFPDRQGRDLQRDHAGSTALRARQCYQRRLDCTD